MTIKIPSVPAGLPDDDETREQWALINTPLGEAWSGRTRYAAAVYFHRIGAMDTGTLEVYRICSRLDDEDPGLVMMDRKVGGDWLKKMAPGP